MAGVSSVPLRRWLAASIVGAVLASACTSSGQTSSSSSTSLSPPTSASVPTAPSGIRTAVPAPVALSAVNEWQRVDHRELLQIWAGSISGRPRDGAMLMRKSKLTSDGSWHPYFTDRYIGPAPDGPLRITAVRGNELRLVAADGRRLSFTLHRFRYSATPTCAPMGAPWSSSACPESVWVRRLISSAGGEILGGKRGIEPQRHSAFLVSMDRYRFSLGAIWKVDVPRMSAYFSMREFSAGIAQAGTVSGVSLAGNRQMGHWSWEVHGFTAELYPASAAEKGHVPRWLAAKLVTAPRSVPQ